MEDKRALEFNLNILIYVPMMKEIEMAWGCVIDNKKGRLK